MSITELRLVPQLKAQADHKQAETTHQLAAIELTQAVIVNREQLTEAYEDVRGVSRQLHNIEDLSELDWCDLSAMMRRIHHATEALAAMLEKGAAAR
ncbi:MAG: hypothetical protein H0W76_07925 [Pyrinomonadaceae bacterium]|nr:hypothetical protein [Pyrinomonadaceae bacterium]